MPRFCSYCTKPLTKPDGSVDWKRRFCDGACANADNRERKVVLRAKIYAAREKLIGKHCPDCKQMVVAKGAKIVSLNQEGKRNRELRHKLSARFGWRCWYCGLKLSIGGGHLDHIVPKSIIGRDKDALGNLALTCCFCNMAKHDHTLEAFLDWLEWIRSGDSFTPYSLSPDEVANRDKGVLSEQTTTVGASQAAT